MSTIHTCSCGAKVRLPAQAGGKTFRCPQCKAEFSTTADAQVLVSTPVRAGGRQGVCPICQTAIAAEELVVTCPSCDQVHHKECWAEVGGCATYGCAQAPAPAKEPAAAEPPRAAWGDTKTCPACGESIKAIALRCRYCGTDFDTVNPLTAADLRQGVRKADDLRSTQSTVITLFVMSLSGCLAPLALILSPFLLWPRRPLIARAGPFYQVLAYSAAGLALLYSVLIGLFLVLS